MYELVKKHKQQKDFEATWEYFCTLYNWENDPYGKNATRYNLITKKKGLFPQKKVIGTVEFTPYDPNNPNSTVEGTNKYSFSKLEELKHLQGTIWEIDKMCIHHDYQRKGYINIFYHVMYEHVINHNPSYYLAIIEKRLYRMLRITLGSNAIVQKGEALVGPTTTLIPTVINAEKLINKVQHFLNQNPQS